MKQKFKQKFKEIEKWVKENSELVLKIKNDNSWNAPNSSERDAIYWYEDVLKNKELMFGNKILTLKDFNIKYDLLTKKILSK